jgi:hypothetical protein
MFKFWQTFTFRMRNIWRRMFINHIFTHWRTYLDIRRRCWNVETEIVNCARVFVRASDNKNISQDKTDMNK